MNEPPRSAIILELVEKLRQHGSWAGHTHVQKAAYFLQELLGVPLNYPFVLYMYGPYSFDLLADLVRLRGNYMLEFDYKAPGYGPGLLVTPLGRRWRDNWRDGLEHYRQQLDFISERLGKKNVAELERLATALYVRRHMSDDASLQAGVQRLLKLKPHVNEEAARAAFQELEEMVRTVPAPSQHGQAEHPGA
jgi:uncharacterized protein YwgA